MKYLFILAFTLIECYICTEAFESSQFQIRHDHITTNLLQTIVERMNKMNLNGYPSEDDSSPAIRSHKNQFPFISSREDEIPNHFDFIEEENIIPRVRDTENLPHSSVWVRQFLADGTEEGRQNLKPEGLIRNKDKVKTDAKLPAYCDPPNPCPVGFSADDGCIQGFENTASFSREYQSVQDCICDFAHMINCP